MLQAYLREVITKNPDYANVLPAVEKEILHHDIMHAMIEQGALQQLTFIGGTSLRLCYNSARLSEDLDFNGGHDFKPSDLDGLEIDIQHYLQAKYELDVRVNKPNPDKQGDTASWRISIEKEPNRPDLPRQKMHIDVCAIPSFQIEKKGLINHYQLDVPTVGLILPVQSLQEALVDKLIALAYRARRIKPRDLWDIVWLQQQAISLNNDLLKQKLEARSKTLNDFKQAIERQVQGLRTSHEIKSDFFNEMTRFIPSAIKTRTLDNPEYWPYLIAQVSQLTELAIQGKNPPPFYMGNA